MKKTATLVAAALLLISAPSRAQGWVNVYPSTFGPQVDSDTGAMSYDPVRGVTLLVSYYNNALRLHGWDGSAWTVLYTDPAHISGYAKSGTWDELHQRTLFHFDDGHIYSWDGISWSFLLGSPNSFKWIQHNPSDNRLYGLRSGGLEYWDYSPSANWFPIGYGVSPGTITGQNDSLYLDPSTQNITSISHPSSSTYGPNFWDWDGYSWHQHYPNPIYAGLGQVAPAAARNISVGVSFDPSYPTPRAWAIANQTFNELFLTSWPNRRTGFLLVYDSNRDRFVMHGGEGITSNMIQGDTWELDLGPNALFTTYGAGCPNSTGITPQIAAQTGTLPSVNTQFSVQVSGLPFTAPSFMWLGFSNQSYSGYPLPLDLGFLGAPGCEVLVTPELLYPIPNILGTSAWTLAIPNLPGSVFYNQVVSLDASFPNSLGLVFSNASESVVGQ